MSEKLLQHTGEEVMFQISTNHRTFSDEGVDDGTSIKWENRSPSFAVEIDFGKPSSGFGYTFLIEPQSKVYNKPRIQLVSATHRLVKRGKLR